jgi:serine/threonine-protein kinase
MGRLVDGRSDLYAVGLLLYEMVTGHPPFDGSDSYAVGYKHVHEQPQPPEQSRADTPAALSAVVMRCLAKQPADRYDRGFDLCDALLACLAAFRAPDDLRTAQVARLGSNTPR